MNIKEIALPTEYLESTDFHVLKGNELKILALLHLYADEYGYLHKSARWYAAKAGIHHNTAMDSLRSLADKFYIEFYSEKPSPIRLIRKVFHVNKCVCTDRKTTPQTPPSDPASSFW